MRLGRRQIYRLRRIFSADGPAGVAQTWPAEQLRKYGETFRATVLSLVREHYLDFGPTLAVEKLIARHGLRIGVETLRQWMVRDDGALYHAPGAIPPTPCQNRDAAMILDRQTPVSLKRKDGPLEIGIKLT